MAKKVKTKSEKVKVEFKVQTRYEGNPYNPGDTLTVDVDTAKRWGKYKMPIAKIVRSEEMETK